MIILKPVSTTQTIKVIPRLNSTNLKITIEDSVTHNTTEYTFTLGSASAYLEGQYMVFERVFSLIEGRTYSLKVIDTDTTQIIYRDNLFCTDQNVLDYSINKDIYTPTTTLDNKYVTP